MNQDPMEEKIFDAIRHGQVKMLPRWHFVVRAALAIVTVVALLLLLIYSASMVIFA